MRRGRLGWTALAAGVLLAAAGMLYSGSVTVRKDHTPAPVDWNDWDGTVVFLGDSITEFCDLERFYPGLRTVNKGISGDTTAGMLERVEEDVCALAPEVAVVHGGINDLSMGASEEAVADNLSAIIGRIQTALPGTQIVLQSVYPVEEYYSLTMTGRIQALNARLETLAEKTGCHYADVYSALAAEDGRLAQGLSDDGLHPNDIGYTAAQPVVAQAIREAIAAREQS